MVPPTSDPFIVLMTEIFRIRGRFRLLFQNFEGSTGLSRIQHAVLATVIEADNPPTVSQLGRNLGYPRQVIQRKTIELINRGLLHMKDNPVDRRACVLVPTRKGLDLKVVADEWTKLNSAELLTKLEPGLCGKITADLRTLRVTIDGHISHGGNRASEESEESD
jgi:DNA-binding MarR family transcriptional regulator